MVLNIFSLTIAITKREREEVSFDKALQQENAKKIFEEHHRKIENYNRIRQY